MKFVVVVALIAVFFSFSACGGGGATFTQPPPPPTHNIWTWRGGSNFANQSATYGTLGVAAAGNNPGPRSSLASAVDASRTLWLFGGINSGPLLSDLWKYSAGEWTWVSGPSTTNQMGVYGTKGVSDPANVPGARYGATAWVDSVGALWLFGGIGYDSANNPGLLSDLWKYSSGQWTWVGGSNLSNVFIGVYGTQGVPSPANFPPGREGGVGWTDASGNLWLYAGNAQSVMNDLWEYSAGEWTWISGGSVGNQVGVYGTRGTPDPANIPGNRIYPSAWIDASGNPWVFGGWGVNASLPYPYLGTYNDLWRYSSGEWTWISGSSGYDQPGSYGAKGTASSSNTPGARSSAVTWSDASGNFWMFGGEYQSFSAGPNAYFNDLWKYDGGQWTWMGGASTAGASGVYGTQGQATSTTIPGARSGGVSWTDSSGNVWLFGGYGYDSAGTLGGLNDLWEYTP